MSETARTIRSRRQLWAAPGSSHDRLMQFLQIVLPIGIGVLTAFLVMAPIFMGGDVSFLLDKNKVDIATERLRIEQARYSGSDAKGQPFRLTARSAVQQSSATPIVKMNGLAAAIALPEGPARLVAGRGAYDMTKESVAIQGPIQFRAADGYAVDTRDATLDLKTRRLTSTGAVDGKTPLGTFTADKLTADLEGRTVSLSGNARLRIVPKRANRP
jgi:lipopolysaccharide export system protein LptC